MWILGSEDRLYWCFVFRVIPFLLLITVMSVNEILKEKGLCVNAWHFEVSGWLSLWQLKKPKYLFSQFLDLTSENTLPTPL